MLFVEHKGAQMENIINKYPDVLDVSQVAEILNVTPATVRRHIKKKEIPAIRVGRLTRIPKDRFISYLDSCTQ